MPTQENSAEAHETQNHCTGQGRGSAADPGAYLPHNSQDLLPILCSIYKEGPIQLVPRLLGSI